MLNSLANLTLTEVLRPKPQGEPVNSHVVPAVREPYPDYEAMNRLVATPRLMPKSSDVREHDEPAAGAR